MGPLLFFLLQQSVKHYKLHQLSLFSFFFPFSFLLSLFSGAVYAEQKSILCLVLSCIPSSQAWQIGGNQRVFVESFPCVVSTSSQCQQHPLFSITHRDSSTTFSLTRLGQLHASRFYELPSGMWHCWHSLELYLSHQGVGGGGVLDEFYQNFLIQS